MLAAALAALVLPASIPADAHAIPVPPVAETRLVLAATGNEARYRVREQLAGVDFPNDAVGVTSGITGEIVLGDDGQVISDRSKIVVDLRGLKSDKERRDGFVQRRTLETERFPTAELVVTRITGLANPLPTSGELTLTIHGNLTVHGTTRGTTWQVTATASPNGYRGTAKTEFTFADFELTKPRVASVLSVDDKIGLEFDFNFERR
ncbi:MAG TPA: YceI family protein [Gemmatimonadales bacterium]|nr:YceI family protein [Gemmatimonadales bacterium]